jgi:hypothetical protein
MFKIDPLKKFSGANGYPPTRMFLKFVEVFSMEVISAE